MVVRLRVPTSFASDPNESRGIVRQGCGCQPQFHLIGIRSDQLPASDSSRLTFDFFFVQSIATTRVLALVHTSFTISLKHSMRGVVQSTIWSLNCTRSPFETHAKPRG